MELEDEDIPPLEDMSELLEQVQKRRAANFPAKIPETTSTKPKMEIPKVTKPSKQAFAGMKKGFLSGCSNTTTPTGKTMAGMSPSKAIPKPVGVGDELLLIKPRGDCGDAKVEHRIGEVQEAMKKPTIPLLESKDRLREDFLFKINKHPQLLKQLADPRISEAMSKFEKNPKQAMLDYRDDAEVQQFLKDYCGVLGDYFTSLEAPSPANPLSSPPNPHPSHGIMTQDPTLTADISIRSSTNPKQATSADEAKMKQLLSDPQIVEILMDKQIQGLMQALRTDPAQGQRILQSLDSDMKPKIQKLVEAGLLGFSR